MAINPFDIIKNFKNIQTSINDMQEKLKSVVVTGTAGGDMVTIEMNCSFEVLNVTISKEAVDPDDIQMLEDLVLAAFTNAVSNVKEKMKEEMIPLSNGMNIPPGFMGT
ncbi:MAG: YbaB/EbfC family nucleoid-associated protein [Spirochaetales bacterium]|nr:YbaB/EbfC family nucleoid-associated protein [Spirochaetales bacterium]